MICLQAIKKKIGKARTAIDSKGGQITTSLISTVAKIGLGRIGADVSDLKKIITSLPNYDNNILIFDDLERCSCNIIDVLGYINNFVEHSDAAIILVANEDEIGLWQLDRNPELQMLVALNQNLDLKADSTRKERLYRTAFNDSQGSESKQNESYNMTNNPQQVRKWNAHINLRITCDINKNIICNTHYG